MVLFQTKKIQHLVLFPQVSLHFPIIYAHSNLHFTPRQNLQVRFSGMERAIERLQAAFFFAHGVNAWRCFLTQVWAHLSWSRGRKRRHFSAHRSSHSVHDYKLKSCRTKSSHPSSFQHEAVIRLTFMRLGGSCRVSGKPCVFNSPYSRWS
jgi:hypothetical protein